MELLMDRSYYRMRGDTGLLERAKYNPTAELAVVLAERLEEVQAEFEERIEGAKEAAQDARLDMNQLDDKIYTLQSEIDKLELMLAKANDAKDTAERHADEIHARMQELEREANEQSEAIRNGDRLLDELSQRIRNLKEQNND